MRTRRWMFMLLLAVLAAPLAARAFVVLDSYFVYDGERIDIDATLANSPRWSAASHAAIDGAGLYDGLQVAVEPGLAEKLVQRITNGNDPEDIAAAQHAILAAFAAWHSPVLTTEVTLDGPAVRGTNAGSEVDVFAVPDTDPVFFGNKYFGVTYLVSRFLDDRMLTNGDVLAGHAIQRADIFLNMDQLAGVARLVPREMQVAALQRLLMHEFGHALGLDHPNEYPFANLDDDADPLTPVQVDPQSPFAGLILSPNIDIDAIMSNKPTLEAAFYTELQPDDRAGLDVLYPAPLMCTGDCDGDGQVTVDELTRGIRASLGAETVADCHAFDEDSSRTVSVDELVRAVDRALHGCGF